MRCSICGIELDSMEEAVEGGWIPYFYEGETEHEFACSGCSEVFLESGKDEERGEGEVSREDNLS